MVQRFRDTSNSKGRERRGQMLRWLSGRLSIQNFRHDLRLAQESFGVHEAREACDFLLRHIYAVKNANRLGPISEHETLERIQGSVLSALPAGWLKRPGREMIATALLEHWVMTKREVLAGSLDQTVFQTIDNELWQFAKDRLKPQEIEAIQVEAAEAQMRTAHPVEVGRQPALGMSKSKEADLG